VTEPDASPDEQPEQTDNRPREDDGDQALVTQDATTDYSTVTLP
jgi:hypothetical protein